MPSPETRDRPPSLPLVRQIPPLALLPLLHTKRCLLIPGGWCEHLSALLVRPRTIHHSSTAVAYGDYMARKCQLDEDRIATAVRLPSSVHRELHAAAADRDVS